MIEIVSEQELTERLRLRCDQAKDRLWIAVPFVGDPSSVRKILGNVWLSKSAMSIRLLTDLSNPSCKDHRSIQLFSNVGEVRSLKGLHAKIYVVDDAVLLTSANLTSTAFSARYEIGQWLIGKEAKSAISIFLRWWAKPSSPDLSDWLKQANPKGFPEDEPFAGGLPKKWQLGKDPGPLPVHPKSDFEDYRSFWSSYKELAQMYGAFQRVWRKAPLYLEVDCFLNYLFHEAPGKPSKPYKDLPPQSLYAIQRKSLLEQWAKAFRDWPGASPEEAERTLSMNAIQSILTKEQVSKLDWPTVGRLAANMHSLRSNALARAKFLNPKNNKLTTISKALLAVVEPGDRPVEAILEDVSVPFGFGRSSAQELLGWSNPAKYPIRNANTNAGMRFFGYSVRKY